MNVKVIHIKDCIKYLVAVGIVCLTIFLLSRYFSTSAKETEDRETESGIQTAMLTCLDKEIPGIQLINKKEELVETKTLQEAERKVIEDVLGTEYKIVESIKLTQQMAEEKTIPQEEQQPPAQETTTPEEIPDTAQTEIQPSNVPNTFNSSYESVEIRNETDYTLAEDMVTPDISVNTKKVLLFHTHTCESYTESEAFHYTPTGNFRTTDNQYNVVRVGEELKTQLEQYGVEVTHDATYHDYPAYTGSYGRSLETVANLLKGNEDTDIVMDLHRDAIADSTYAPTVKIGEEYAARLMFVIGTDGGGLWHDHWNQNLKFAIKLQQKANEMYPGLFKPIIVRNSRYNQHLAKAASIIEVGATGNTMEQCLTSMKYLAKIISKLE